MYLQEKNKKLSKELEDDRQRETQIDSQVEEAKFSANLARSNQNEQYSRLWNLKILFIPEKSSTAQETPDESEKEALCDFYDLLGLRHITPEHMDAVHRIGKKNEGRSRPIIVHFVSRKTRLEVLRKRWKIKGADPKVVIVEDLTRSHYQLFLRASEHPGALTSWSKDGKIFAQSLDFKTFAVFQYPGLCLLYSRLCADVQPFGTIKWTDVFMSVPYTKTESRQRGKRFLLLVVKLLCKTIN